MHSLAVFFLLLLVVAAIFRRISSAPLDALFLHALSFLSSSDARNSGERPLLFSSQVRFPQAAASCWRMNEWLSLSLSQRLNFDSRKRESNETKTVTFAPFPFRDQALKTLSRRAETSSVLKLTRDEKNKAQN